MATHSSILAWRILWMEDPGGLQSTGLQRVGHDWETSLHFTSDALEMDTLDVSSLGLSGEKNEPIREYGKWKEICHSGRFSYLQSPKTRLSSLVSTLYICYHPTIASFLDYLQLLLCQFQFLNFQLWWEKRDLNSSDWGYLSSFPSHFFMGTQQGLYSSLIVSDY